MELLEIEYIINIKKTKKILNNFMKEVRKYTIEEKLRCVEFAEKNGIKNVSELTGINGKLLREWLKKRNQLKNIENKEKKFRLPGGGGKPKTLIHENYLVNFINDCMKKKINVDASFIINEICRIDPEMKKKSQKALRSWCHRFLKRNKFT
jgi:hypothetical protein